MSFGGLGGGLIGGALAGMMGGAMDAVLGDDDILMSPIPAFYFEVDYYVAEKLNQKKISTPEEAGLLGSMGANALAAAKGMISGPNTLDPGGTERWEEKAFIEVTGLGLESDNNSKNYGGDNYPVDIVGPMKNPHVVLKRLVRPKNLKDGWNTWIKDTMHSMAYWDKPIETRYIQINVMHPNLNQDGDPFILYSVDLVRAYPCKVSYSSLNSTSEDLFVQEIEISYRYMVPVEPA